MNKKNYKYPWEKFHVAVLTLSGSSTPIQERLADAYTGSIIRLNVNDMPEILKNDFQDICKNFSIIEADAWKNAKLLNDYDAKKLAEKIVSVYDALARIDGLETRGALS